ncbi:MAG: cyclic nucleotide-binding domain-containing protein [Candidatus Rokubacteria bacterium]|nr:cyclic nucleotide-binding domain-containing protein [Candidatus Rokubacteria bacterium]
MAAAELREVVRSVLCRGLTAEQADQLVRTTVPLETRAGTPVFREGDAPMGLLILVEGTVEIARRGPDGAERTIATIDAPTVLGEMSLVTDQPHSATVRARTDCRFHLLTKTQFHRLLGGESVAAYKLIATVAEVLARRLQRMDDKVLELLARREGAAPVEELAVFKQKLFSEWSF